MKVIRSINTLISIISVFVIFTTWGILHVWTRNLAMDLGYALSEQQTLNEKLMSDNKALRLEISTLKSSERLEYIARDVLGLHEPRPDQVMHIWLDE